LPLYIKDGIDAPRKSFSHNDFQANIVQFGVAMGAAVLYSTHMNSTLTAQPTKIGTANASGSHLPFGADFLYAGRASYLVRNPKGTRVTVKLSKAKGKTDPRTGRPYAETFFVSVRSMNDPWVYVGRVARDARRITLAPAAMSAASTVLGIAVAEWSLRVINGETPLPAGYSIEHTGRCGRCYKLLTDPVSIACGLGPICRG